MPRTWGSPRPSTVPLSTQPWPIQRATRCALSGWRTSSRASRAASARRTSTAGLMRCAAAAGAAIVASSWAASPALTRRAVRSRSGFPSPSGRGTSSTSIRLGDSRSRCAWPRVARPRSRCVRMSASPSRTGSSGLPPPKPASWHKTSSPGASPYGRSRAHAPRGQAGAPAQLRSPAWTAAGEPSS